MGSCPKNSTAIKSVNGYKQQHIVTMACTILNCKYCFLVNSDVIYVCVSVGVSGGGEGGGAEINQNYLNFY